MSNKNVTRRTFLSRVAAGLAAFVLAVTLAACGTTAATDASSEAATDEAALAVTVEIDATAGEGEQNSYDVSLDEGATAYDALVATGVDVNASDSEYGMYVEGIDGVAAGDFGDMSGWLYSVNDEEADVSCSEYQLEDGDVVTWTYVTEFTE